MDQNFQTSFIPKKPMIQERAVSSQPIGFLTIVSIFILFSVCLGTIGLYFYKGILTKNIVKMETNLNLVKASFEPSRIAELQVLDKRLNAATEILSKHVAITPLFKILEDVTMKRMRYTKFGYELGEGKNSRVLITMSGVAIGYAPIALQSDLFTKEKNLIDPVFSNLNLDEKGNVFFDLEFSVDPALVDYKQMLLRGV